MTFNPSIPQPNDLLATSQGNILNNMGALNSVYGVDHYAYNDTSGNATFHKKITTPPLGAHPNADTNSILYSYEDIASVGPIQYSKGKTRLDQGNQVSTPITSIQSSQTPISLTNGANSTIFNFTGISRAFARVIVGNFSSSGSGRFINSAEILYAGSGPGFAILLGGSNSSNLAITASGSNLIVVNGTGSTVNNVFWTLQFLRIEI